MKRKMKAPKAKRLVSAKQITRNNRFARNNKGAGAPKKTGGTVHLNREQFNARHIHCTNIRMVYADMERTLSDHVSYGLGVAHKIKGRDHTPPMKAHCDHPEDGMCGQNPTDDQLAWINDKLSGKLFKVEEVQDGELNGHEPKVPTSSARSNLVSIPSRADGDGTTPKRKFTFKLGGLDGS